MAKLKVWHGRAFVKGTRQVYAVVAATSQRKACEVIGCSIPHLKDYWQLTTKPELVEAAHKQPETLMTATLVRKWVPADKWDYPPRID